MGEYPSLRGPSDCAETDHMTLKWGSDSWEGVHSREGTPHIEGTPRFLMGGDPYALVYIYYFLRV